MTSDALARNPTIGLNLLTCNRTPLHRKATEVAVRGLLESDLGLVTARLVAVDNGSSDDTADWLRGQGFRVEALSRNEGIAPARNRATGLLLEDPAIWAVIEIHNDMVFPKRWLLPLLEALEADSEVGIACASLMTPRGILGSPSVPIDYGWPYERIREVVQKAAIPSRRPGLLRPGLQHPAAKRASMLREIGFYDEGFRWGNFEDTDEVYRAASHGWKYLVVGESIVWHHYLFSRLKLDPDHQASFRANYRRFIEKWPDAHDFLLRYNAQTEAIYR